jgi:uncharacterized membrane protein
VFVVVASFLLGITSGLRALTGLAVLSWAARLGYLPLQHTWLAFLGYAFTPYIVSLTAIGELLNDKLPKTPSRLIAAQFITRLVTGALCGVALGLSGFGATLFGRDLPVALLEDAAAISIAVIAVALIR